MASIPRQTRYYYITVPGRRAVQSLMVGQSLALSSEYPPSSSAASIEKEYDAIRNSVSSSNCITFFCEEVSEVKFTLKRNKAAGKDNIDPEQYLEVTPS